MFHINYFETFTYILAGLFSICTILFIFLYEWRSPNHRRACRQLPGPKLKPILGIGVDLMRLKDTEILDFYGNLVKEHGSLVYYEIFGMPFVLVNDPDDVKKILNSKEPKGIEYRFVANVLGEGLVTSTGAKWQMRRKMLTPTFHLKIILENYLPVFNRNAHLLTKKFLETSGQPCEDVDAYSYSCTLDVVCETLMGICLHSQIGNVKEYVTSLQRAGEIVMQRTLNFWYFRDWIFFNIPIGREFTEHAKILHAFTDKVIKERKEKNVGFIDNTVAEPGKYKNGYSFLDNLIEMQKETPEIMTDQDIREEVDTFMNVGHESTSVAIAWLLYLLAKHPDVQERVRKEIWSILGKTDRDVTIDDIRRMWYLDMVIKEALRLYSIAPYISRFTTSDLHLKNYTIPAKTNVVMILYLMHHNPEYFPDPEKFDPDRFLPEAVKERHQFAYLPFGTGPRGCIGQKFGMLEMAIIISTILRKLVVKEGPIKQTIKGVPCTVLQPSEKIILSFTKVFD